VSLPPGPSVDLSGPADGPELHARAERAIILGFFLEGGLGLILLETKRGNALVAFPESRLVVCLDPSLWRKLHICNSKYRASQFYHY